MTARRRGDLLKASSAFSHSHSELIKLWFSDRQKAGCLSWPTFPLTFPIHPKLSYQRCSSHTTPLSDREPQMVIKPHGLAFLFIPYEMMTLFMTGCKQTPSVSSQSVFYQYSRAEPSRPPSRVCVMSERMVVTPRPSLCSLLHCVGLIREQTVQFI